MNVVLTGPAIDGAGHFIIRADLALICGSHGINVQPAVKPDTHILVASRSDTVKAKRAQGCGKKVMTYPEFLARFLPEVVIPKQSEPNRHLDKVAAGGACVPAEVGFERLDGA